MLGQEDIPQPSEAKLSPEQTAKTDKDMATLTSLTNYAENHGTVLEVGGGYAVEAYFGGRMTRPHGDMDAVLWLPDPDMEGQARTDVTQILFNEPTAWTEFPNLKSRSNFIEFREVAPENEFEDSRRLELYLYDKNRMRDTVEKSLIDSSGIDHKIRVALLEQIVASKVSIFNRTPEQQANKRGTRQTDVDDFKRLINHPEFNKAKYLELRAGALMEEDANLTKAQALELAEKQFIDAIEIANNYSQQGSL